jgi:hypothetical protein
MRDHDGDIRGFYHLSEAWYGPANLPNENVVDEVTFGHFAPEGGTSGEMSIKWYDLGSKVYLCLECFDDAWSSLSTFTDLIVEIGKLDGEKPTPKEFCELLIRLGFKDLTPRENPYTAKGAKLSREALLELALGDILTELSVSGPVNKGIQTLVKSAKQLLERR